MSDRSFFTFLDEDERPIAAAAEVKATENILEGLRLLNESCQQYSKYLSSVFGVPKHLIAPYMPPLPEIAPLGPMGALARQDGRGFAEAPHLLDMGKAIVGGMPSPEVLRLLQTCLERPRYPYVVGKTPLGEDIWMHPLTSEPEFSSDNGDDEGEDEDEA